MSILVAVSDDGRFEPVLAVAAELAAGLETELRVAHLTTNESASGDERSFKTTVQEFVSDADVPTAVDIEHLERSSLRSGTAIGKQLVEFTTDVNVDHVVIGHRSKGRVASAREGHTGFTVVEEASVPVTIVPAAVDAEQ